MVGRLDLSDTSTEVHPGSERELNGSFVNLNLSNVSASTFESGPSPPKFGIDIIPERTASSEEGETFVTEALTGNESESSFFEEPDSPREMPPLQAAPLLRDVTNLSPTQYEPPEKAGKLDNLNEPFPLLINETTETTEAARDNCQRNRPLLMSANISSERGPVATHSRSQFLLLFRNPEFC